MRPCEYTDPVSLGYLARLIGFVQSIIYRKLNQDISSKQGVKSYSKIALRCQVRLFGETG